MSVDDAIDSGFTKDDLLRFDIEALTCFGTDMIDLLADHEQESDVIALNAFCCEHHGEQTALGVACAAAIEGVVFKSDREEWRDRVHVCGVEEFWVGIVARGQEVPTVFGDILASCLVAKLCEAELKVFEVILFIGGDGVDLKPVCEDVTDRGFIKRVRE